MIDFRWMKADNFELVGPRVEHMNIKEITIRGLSTARSNDFLENANSHVQSDVGSELSQRLQGRNLLFETAVMTISEDQTSIVYIFFSDTDGGISAIATNDFGKSWYYYYGIIEKLLDQDALNPFAVTDFGHNTCYLFYLYMNKILCKTIPFSMFKFQDINLIQRFDDIYTPADPEDSESLAIEAESIYTTDGYNLRWRVSAFVAQGDMTDETFLEVLGKVPGDLEYEPFESRQIGGQEVNVRKNPIARSGTTAFTNKDQQDMFFSAYRNDVGELKLWFMGETTSGTELQCNFSLDNGATWYDLWEFMEHGYNRLRYDSEQKTQFIDRNASGDPPADKEATYPQQSNQTASFGINIHWSRLKKHKVNAGNSTLNSESQVLDISSPYLFHQSTTDRVFLFYIYQGCLLCKIFSDSLFSNAAEAKQNDAEKSGMALLKEVIEQQTRAHFIDGSLTNADLQEELHRFVREEERMAQGNIIFRYRFIDTFTDDRVISS